MVWLVSYVGWATKHDSDGFASFLYRTHAKYSPIADQVAAVFDQARDAKAAAEKREAA